MRFRDDLRPDRMLEVEKEALDLWDREKTFEASLLARREAKPFVFYEGPPTANGKPGVHHVISRSIKDFACRWKTMQGFLVERKAGWDTHGLPVEIAAEKKLGLEGKDAIERLGIAEFNRVCRESVFQYLTDWEAMTRRIGYWVDMKQAYMTCSNEYVESLWAILADLHGRGLLYKGHKVLPYCPRCGTPLSSHEVGQGFKDVQDPSVFVRFRALDAAGAELPEAFLVWTTTPWTLPSNVALAVHPDVDYVRVRVTEGDGKDEVLWLAEPRVPALKAKPGTVEVLEKVKGKALVGRRYRRLLDLYDVPAAPNAFTVRPATFVTTEDGTGIVHMAPAYGEDDASVGRRDALPVLHPVDAAGRFTAGPRAALVAGKFVKDADKDVLKQLKSDGALLRQETVVHSYPHCWRCETPLLYYARESWYLKTTQFRDRMLELNAAVTWFPESTGTGRFGQWLENNVDWALSRDRYWGTPLPIWVCDGCAAQQAVGSVAELRKLAGGLEGELDLHRPYVDRPTWACGGKGCAGTMRRTPEVADCWFDSGAMPFAQWHFPFENRDRVEREVPADFIAEAVDQTRGWFYTLLAVSTMYADKPAYRAVVSNDHILDAKGKKMSKSKGNVVEPMGILAAHGADVVRWHLLTSRPLWQPMRFDEKDLVEVRNRVFGTLASTYQFFAMYANVDGFEGREPEAGWRPKDVSDRWLLSRLERLVGEVTADLKGYELSKAGKRLADFVVEDLSNWYVRRNRRRFWKGALGDDKSDAYRTLQRALLVVCRLLAPFSPFLPDAIHRALLPGAAGAEGSVHLAAWPVPELTNRDAELEERMDALRSAVSLGHAARNKGGVKVRQPLPSVTVGHPDPAVRAFLVEYAEVGRDELNVKRFDVVDGFERSARLRASLDKKAAARRLGALTAPAEAALAALDSGGVARLADALRTAPEAGTPVPTSSGPAMLLAGDVRFVTEDVAGSASEYDRGMLVRLDTSVTPELRAEGLAREVLRAIQQHRKAREFAVTDRVRMRWWSPDAALVAAIERHAAWLSEEALMTGMDVPPWWATELADAPVGPAAAETPGAPVAEGSPRAAVAIEDHRFFFELHKAEA